jgi:hypothetical protein
MKRNTHQLFRIAIKILCGYSFIDVLVAGVLDNSLIHVLHPRAEGKDLKAKLPYIALYGLGEKIAVGLQVDRILA